MNIIVKLYGTLRQYRPATADGAAHHPFTIDLFQGDRVATLVAKLDVPNASINAIAVNGDQATMSTVLSEGDTVHLFPPAAGG